MTALIPFFIIFIVGLVFTGLSSRLRLPYVTALILAGIVFGPFGLRAVELNEGIEFFASIGLIFLMFIAGSKINLKSLTEDTDEILALAFINSIVPFVVGFGIGLVLLQDFYTALLIGVIFISSAVAVIVPILESGNFLGSRMGKLILASTVIADIASLFMLGIILQVGSEGGFASLVAFILIIALSILFLGEYLPKLEKRFREWIGKNDVFESELRFILVILFAAVILFEIIGLNAIVAAFIVGMIFSEVMKKGQLERKVKTLSYGMFIPVFFFTIGMQTDLSTFATAGSVVLVIAVVAGSVISKVSSGYFAGRLMQFDNKQSLFIGMATVPQLTTTLAVTFAAAESNLIEPDLVAAMVVLTVLTSLITPVVLNQLSEQISKRSLNTRNTEQIPVIVDAE